MIDRAQINLKGGPPVPGPGESLHLWPPLAGDPAPGVDHLFLYLLTVTVFFTLLVFVLIVFFALRYRRVPGRKAQQLPTARWLEVTWTVVPGVIVIGTFFWAAAQYVHMKQTPAGATRMYVVGKQWMWKIQHPTGKREINTLHVPVGQTIELTMTSEDTIHSFYLPAFRQKQDVLPGRYTTLWFKATTPGEYHLFCAEYCGTDHSKMGGKLVVMQPADYQAWLADLPEGAESPQRAGAELFVSKGCAACHGQRGPTLAGLYGATVKLEGGGEATADEAYLRESILNPSTKVVAGWPPLMPTYQGQLSEEQLFSLVTYIESLKGGAQADSKGRAN